VNGEPVEVGLDDLLDAADEPLTSEPDPHALTRTRHPWGVAWACACGRWEAVSTGRASALFVQGDYRRHRHVEETAGRG
jgi:hypothetical protein